MIKLERLNKSGLNDAQELVARSHYLRRRVDPRCSPFGYQVLANRRPAGVLIFGRPQATRCADWYGSVADWNAGRCAASRWEVINLARVYVLPEYQPGGEFYGAVCLPGFIDRRGVWRSTLASSIVSQALDQIVVDYLTERPPCFPDEPYQLTWCMSYCDTRLHRGTVYRASGFELYRTNEDGIQTWRRRLRPLTAAEDAMVLQACATSPRSRAYRAARNQQTLVA